jgi:inosine-uridine nucleoside N-ribohydrolase
MIAEQSRTFWQWLSTLREGMPNDRSPAHDPLALLAAIEPEHFALTPMTVEVDAEGRVTGTPDERSPAQVVTDLDAEGARQALLRLLRG